MRLLLGLLLAAALSLELAQALQCHQCKGFGGCAQKTKCPSRSSHCISIATRAPSNFPDLPLITKMCYRGCPDISTLGLGPYVSIVCCQASLCNRD